MPSDGRKINEANGLFIICQKIFYAMILMPNMELLIILYTDKFRLEIRQKSRVVDHAKLRHGVLGRDRRRQFYVLDFETAKYYHDLNEVLITRLDKLLRRNIIDVKSLKSYKIQENVGTDSTSYKITAAFIEGLKA